MTFARLTSRFGLAAQLDLEALAIAKASGYTDIACFRPNAEAGHFPREAAMAAEAARLGLRFHYAPMRDMSPTAAARQAVAASAEGDVRMLGYCKSGRRAAVAWLQAELEQGTPLADALDQARAAGHDLAGLASQFTGSD